MMVLLTEDKSLGYGQVLLPEISGIQFECGVVASRYVRSAMQGWNVIRASRHLDNG